MAPPEVFDTSVLIPIISSGTHEDLLRRSLRSGRFRLSSVVAMELYAGTRTPGEKSDLDQMIDSLRRRGLLIFPTFEEWTLAGQLLARRRRLAGDLNPRDHVSDVLIVISAARIGAVIVTANQRHMRTWADMVRRVGLSVSVVAP